MPGRQAPPLHESLPPPRRRLVTAPPSAPRLGFELPERFGPSEDNELVPGANRRIRFGIEFHPVILSLNADDDDAEAPSDVGVLNGALDEPRPGRDGNLLDREVEIVGARR